jgi:hypothetical protein
LEDPAKSRGSEEEILSLFRKTRDAIRHRVRELIHDLECERSRAEDQ